MPEKKVDQKMVAEMLKLRKEGGYSNNEIANRFGLSHQTVLHYIGRENGVARTAEAPKRQVVANLKTISKCVTLQGACNSYSVNVSDGVCYIHDVLYDRIGLETLIAEVQMIISMIDKEQNDG